MNNKQKIPKTIHYCWFGGKPLPPLAKKCMRSWKKMLPGYKLQLWNEKNFNIKANKFVYGAYKAKKWAYITDYVRAWALYNFGGLYMDTDVEVIKNLDRFLYHSAFSGFEDHKNIPTGLMAAEKNNRWIKEILDYYKDRPFDKSKITPNTIIISNLSKKFGFAPNNKYQILKHDVHLYPNKYFCPKHWDNSTLEISKDTYTIHHFAGSWITKESKITIFLKKTKHFLVYKLLNKKGVL